MNCKSRIILPEQHEKHCLAIQSLWYERHWKMAHERAELWWIFKASMQSLYWMLIHYHYRSTLQLLLRTSSLSVWWIVSHSFISNEFTQMIDINSLLLITEDRSCSMWLWWDLRICLSMFKDRLIIYFSYFEYLSASMWMTSSFTSKS